MCYIVLRRRGVRAPVSLCKLLARKLFVFFAVACLVCLCARIYFAVAYVL